MEIEEADGEQQFHNLVSRGLRANLIPEERNLHVYGNGCLLVVGKFECRGKK